MEKEMKKEQVLNILKAFAEKNQIDPQELLREFQSETPQNQQAFLQEAMAELQPATEQPMAQTGKTPVNTNGYYELDPLEEPEVIIPSGDITMEGIDFDIDAYDANTGQHLDRMKPGKNYKFDTDRVLEKPVYAQQGKEKEVTKVDSNYVYFSDGSKLTTSQFKEDYSDRIGSLNTNKYNTQERRDVASILQSYQNIVSPNKSFLEETKEDISNFIDIGNVTPEDLKQESNFIDGADYYLSKEREAARLTPENRKKQNKAWSNAWNVAKNPGRILESLGNSWEDSDINAAFKGAGNIIDHFSGNEKEEIEKLSNDGEGFWAKVKDAFDIDEQDMRGHAFGKPLNSDSSPVQRESIPFKYPARKTKKQEEVQTQTSSTPKSTQKLKKKESETVDLLEDFNNPTWGGKSNYEVDYIERTPKASVNIGTTLDNRDLKKEISNHVIPGDKRRLLGRYDTNAPMTAFNEMQAQANQRLKDPYKGTPELRYTDLPLIEIDPIISDIKSQEYATLQNVDTSTAAGMAYAANIQGNTQKAIQDTHNKVNQINQDRFAQNFGAHDNIVNQSNNNRVNADRQYVDDLNQAEAVRDSMRLNSKDYMDKVQGNKIRTKNQMVNTLMNNPQIEIEDLGDGTFDTYLDTSYKFEKGVSPLNKTTDLGEGLIYQDGKVYRTVGKQTKEDVLFKQTGGRKKPKFNFKISTY